MPYRKLTLYVDEKDIEKLREIAKNKGYLVKRGPHSGGGSISKLNHAIASGELTLIRLGRHT